MTIEQLVKISDYIKEKFVERDRYEPVGIYCDPHDSVHFLIKEKGSLGSDYDFVAPKEGAAYIKTLHKRAL